jgi:hypothetical protein
MSAKNPCVICGKPCSLPTEKNSDGTWAHDDCLRGSQTPFVPK